MKKNKKHAHTRNMAIHQNIGLEINTIPACCDFSTLRLGMPNLDLFTDIWPPVIPGSLQFPARRHLGLAAAVAVGEEEAREK